MPLALLLALLLIPSSAWAMICPKMGSTYTCADTGNPNTNGVNLGETFLAVVCGDTVILPHGVKFIAGPQGVGGTTSFTGWGNCSGNVVTIKSDELSALPAGQRVGYADLAHMPILSTGTSQPTVTYNTNAGGYTWQGILFTTENLAGIGFAPTIVYQAFDDSATTHDLVYDRVVIRPYEESQPGPPNTVRSAAIGIRLDGASNSVINSTIDGFCCKQSDDGTTPTQSEAIGIVGGAGPYTITNNYLGAYGWNIFTGGGGDNAPGNSASLSAQTFTSATFSSTTNLHIGDTIRLHYPATWVGKCHNANVVGNDNFLAGAHVTNIVGSVVTWAFFGPPGSIPPGGTELADGAAWNPTAPMVGFNVQRNTLNKRAAWAANSGQCKSFWEMKEGSAVFFNGNILTGPTDAASGTFCPITVALATNQSGVNPWVVSNNNVFTNNLMLGVGLVGAKQPYSAYCPANGGSGLTFSNNLLGNPPGGSRFDFWDNTDGSTWTISHNTVLGSSNRIMKSDPQPIFGGAQYTNTVTFQDNIVSGVLGYFQPSVNFSTDFAGMNTNHNLIIDASGCTGNGSVPLCNGWTKGTGDLLFTSGSTTDIVFVNLSTCSAIDGFGAGGDYHTCALQAGSPGHNTASDGSDIGVNFAQLDAALAGNPIGPGGGKICCGATLRGGATLR